MAVTEIKKLRILVSGSVQGVWYRASAREKASETGLKGWAKNLSDGRVELLVVGSDEKVDEFVRWCGEGPPAAEVSHVETAMVEDIDVPDEFEIRR